MIELPWPSKALHPNFRSRHWGAKARAIRKYRNAAYLLTMTAGFKNIQHYPALHLNITFHPPSAHRHDRDNLLASLKAGIDGIADATGVNDANYTTDVTIGSVIKGGKVTVQLQGISE